MFAPMTLHPKHPITACLVLSQFCQILVLLSKLKTKRRTRFTCAAGGMLPLSMVLDFLAKRRGLSFVIQKRKSEPKSALGQMKKRQKRQLGLVLKLGRLLQSWSSCSQCCWKDLGRFGPNPTVIPSLPVQFDVLLLPQHF